MNYIPGPKAVNIIRPFNNKQNDYTPSSKKKKPLLNLYDPKQLPPLLKKPKLDLYKVPNYIIPEKKQVLSEKLLMMHNKRESSIVSSNNSSSISSSDYSSSLSIKSDSSHNTEDEDARINRKMADLEISNQSLLKINEMLESTVRQQAKQVASFKQKMMTLPNNDNSEQKKRDADLLFLQQQVLLENEDDWEKDEQFSRLRRMTESLIEEAQKALEYRVESGARVLSNSQHRRSNSTRRLHRRRSERNQSELITKISSESSLNQ